MNIREYGLTELDATELVAVDGGIDVWQAAKDAAAAAALLAEQAAKGVNALINFVAGS